MARAIASRDHGAATVARVHAHERNSTRER
jgi:hypothetical protein